MTHAFGRDIAFSFDARPRPKRHSSWLICVLLALHGCGGGSSSSQGSASSVNASSGATAGAMSAQTGNGTVASGPNNASDTPIPDIPSSAPPTPAPYASGQPMGKWSALHDWPQVAINLTLLPDGKVLSWANEAVDDHRAGMSGRVYIADIRNDGAPASFTAVHNTTTNLFCSGMTFLPDGRLLVAGGETSDYTGSAHANIFDFRNYTWQRIANMNRGRWYPTTTSLASGEVLVLGGWDDTEGTGTNTLPQVWRVEGGWRDLTGALFDVGAYPRMHLAPGGRVFGTFQNTGGSRYLDTSGTGAWADAAPPRFPFPRDYGSSVMYDEGKVIVMGGAMDPPTETAEIIDLNAAAPAWEWTGSMKHRRRQINATIMADGNVLVTGGTSTPGWNDAADAVLPAEMWNPRTGQWTTMASMNVPRLYHSTAVLLPDGRVLSAGAGQRHQQLHRRVLFAALSLQRCAAHDHQCAPIGAIRPKILRADTGRRRGGEGDLGTAVVGDPCLQHEPAHQPSGSGENRRRRVHGCAARPEPDAARPLHAVSHQRQGRALHRENRADHVTRHGHRAQPAFVEHSPGMGQHVGRTVQVSLEQHRGTHALFHFSDCPGQRGGDGARTCAYPWRDPRQQGRAAGRCTRGRTMEDSRSVNRSRRARAGTSTVLPAQYRGKAQLHRAARPGSLRR